MKIDSSTNIQSTTKIEDFAVQANSADSKTTKSMINSQEMEVSESLLNKSIEKANLELVKSNRKIERTVHETTKAIMYKVIDVETHEIIKEFPPEKIQDMIAKMWELAGLFVDEHA